jgi:two-component system, NtrC family, response regulator GlrR
VGNKDDEVFETLPLEGPLPDPAESVRVFRLEVTEGPAAGTSWVSSGETGVIGSDPGCDLVVADPTVSRFHCEIRLGREGARLRDTGSRNGTSVDGVRVNDAFLRGGSAVRVGRSTVRFEFVDGRNQLSLSKARQFGKLRGESVAMRQAFAVLERAAGSSATVLLEGETGTGKTAAARSLHLEGPRRDGPFVVIDCGAIPANLLESELFGHEKGAFTGADTRRVGALEEASGGTLFLDEIGELPSELQPKLLGVLENREVKPVGGSRRVPVDVRLVAATNRDLRAEVNEGRFRPDLYFRLAVIKLEMPALRARPEDISAITYQLLLDLGAPEPAIRNLMTPRFVQRLRSAAWPGNVRELKNYLERCLVFEEAQPLDLPAGEPESPVDVALPFAEARRRNGEAFERRYLLTLLDSKGGRVADAAAHAGIDRTHFYRLLRKHRINRT